MNKAQFDLMASLGSEATILKDHDGPSTKGPRIRKLNNWELKHYSDGVPYLVGFTVEDAGRQIVGFMRATTTSPIASINGRVATTQSGSNYTLLTAKEGQVDIESKAFNLRAPE